MLKDRGKRLASIRRRTLVMATMALIVPVTALATASPAMAEPKGIFKIFKECPLEYVPAGLAQCSYNVTSSGEFKLGSTAVPINKNIVLQGGNIPTGNPENEAEYFALPAKNGESLSKTELNVPGGITGLVKCEEITGSGPVETFFRELCKKTLESGSQQVTATSEIAATEKNPVIVNEFALSRQEGTALTLPLKVHLKNALLGNNCYVGSEASPLQLHLTTGETHPPAGFKSLKGARGRPETLEENGLEMLRITKNSLVDNTFTAPEASGCGEATILGFKITGFLDGLVSAKSKLPAKAGESQAILDGELNIADPENVIASEK